jgi:hypothetical protein
MELHLFALMAWYLTNEEFYPISFLFKIQHPDHWLELWTVTSLSPFLIPFLRPVFTVASSYL